MLEMGHYNVKPTIYHVISNISTILYLDLDLNGIFFSLL